MLQDANISKFESPIDSDAIFEQKPAQESKIGSSPLFHNLPYCELKWQVKLLGNKCDLARYSPYRKVAEWFIIQEDAAGGASQYAGSQTEKCSFTDTIRADQRGTATLIQIEACGLNYGTFSIIKTHIDKTQEWVHSA
jgi:hypothetical protein